MEATYTPVQGVQVPVSRMKPLEATKAAARAIGRVLAESAKGDDFNRAFDGSSGATFAAAPRSQQIRMLDRGFRP